MAMADQILDEARRLADRAAVAGEVDRFGPAHELGEGSHVIAHRAVGGRDDRGRPAHHVIAGKQDACLLERVGHVVRGVAGRGDGLEGESVPAHDRAVGKRHVRAERLVPAGIEPRGLRGMQRSRRPVRALGVDGRAGLGLEPSRPGRMVPVGMGDENVRDGLAAHRIQNGGQVARVIRSGVDHRDFAAPDEVGERPLEGERPGVVGEDAPQPGRGFLDGFRGEVERLIERDVVGHGLAAVTPTRVNRGSRADRSPTRTLAAFRRDRGTRRACGSSPWWPATCGHRAWSCRCACPRSPPPPRAD